MAITTLAVRQFYFIPASEGAFIRPASTYVVTGSESRLLINAGRADLANDSFMINEAEYSSNTSNGWWPSPSIDGATGYGIIVGGNGSFSNTSPDGRTSNVSCWGWPAQEDQAANNAEFIALASNIFNTTFANTGSVKTLLQTRGYYYQFPTGYDGQSPGTGPGSDS